MANEFTEKEWRQIRTELDGDPEAYGLPPRIYGSVVVGSFNIRKLGKLRGPASKKGRNEATMRFLADVCRSFDLVAVQEVMPEMAGIRRLKKLLEPEYGLMVSDIVGTFPGEKGSEERLAYLYNRALVERTELVTEVSTSRSKMLRTMALHHQNLFDTMNKNRAAKALRNYYEKVLPEYESAVKKGSKRKEPRMPKFQVNPGKFLQFVRTPFAASFRVRAHPGLEHYPFLAVNAHLQFGTPSERKLEAAALIEWILGKVRSGEARNIVIMGDLNFDFDNPKRDLARIAKKYTELGGLSGKKKVFVSFPFIVPHPRPMQQQAQDEVFRSNIRKTQSYDQIGIFSNDSRLGGFLATNPDGTHSAEETWGKPDGPDYGVFNFADLFSQALEGKPLAGLASEDRKALLRRFEHSVSDHMPIWLRMPLPKPPATGSFPTRVV